MDKSVFSGWEIVEKLGAGAFSTVYKIRKEDGLGGEYFSALKVISIPNSEDEYKQYRDEGFDDESISKLFEQQMQSVTSEFKLLSTFKGAPNIVTFEDYKVQQQEDGIGWTAYIKMELLTALPDAYRAQPLTVEDTVKLGTDICNALMLCEQKNIIHRDIKPQNIFVSEFGDYKLGDFGIARNMDHATQATKIGTPAYMAPEVYRGDSYGPNVDIYSLGMVLYWLLNERRMPFLPLPPQMPTAEQTSNAHAKRLGGATLPPPKNGTDALKQAVLKACAFDPKQRYTTAKEFKAALSKALTATAIPTPAVKSVAPPPLISKQEDLEATVAVRKAPPAPVVQDIEKTTAVRKAPKATEEKQSSITPPPTTKTTEKLKKWQIAVLVLILSVCFLSVIGTFVYPYFIDNNEDDGYAHNDDVFANSSVAEPVNKWGDNITWTLKDGTLTINGSGKMNNFEEDSTNDWLANKKDIKNVVINSGVTSIGAYVFSNCDSLTNITIPNSVTSIGRRAFSGCTSLTSITIPDGVTSIEDEVFRWCTSLTSVNIPDSVTSIGDDAFYNCYSLTSVTIPNSVTSIGNAAFNRCGALTSITIPNSVTSIGDYAFHNCYSLINVNYNGTKAQMAKIEMDSAWVFFTVVHCTDGDVAV